MMLKVFLHYREFQQQFISFGKAIVKATIELYTSALENLLPTPAKSHYLFNLRDIGRVIQGVLLSRPNTVSSLESLKRLWVHEVLFSGFLIMITIMFFIMAFEKIVVVLIFSFRSFVFFMIVWWMMLIVHGLLSM